MALRSQHASFASTLTFWAVQLSDCVAYGVSLRV